LCKNTIRKLSAFSGQLMTSIEDFISHSYSNCKNRINDSARRLSVRIPAEEWEADVTSHGSEHTNVKIANISADGAYLIMKNEFRLDSTMSMYIKSPRLSFHTEATVIHANPDGIGVCFLDLDRAIRVSLLSQVSKHMLQNHIW
jgi:hypothetical protein